MKEPDDIVHTLYGCETFYRKCPAYCKFHHKYLTTHQLKEKQCLGKQCKLLLKIEHPYWQFRNKKKQLKKANKENVIVTTKPLIIQKVFIEKIIASLDELVFYGAFKFFDKDQKIANACFYDKTSSKYRLGYVIESRDEKLEYTYVFKSDTSSRYILPFKDLKKIRNWCY